VDVVTDLVLGAVASPWVYVLLLALVVIDGFFPPVPSETSIVAVAAIGVSSGTPNAWLVILVATVGAAIGDNISYAVGRRVGSHRFAWMRGPRVSAAIDRAAHGLKHRATILILTARYVPVGRVAVNMTAGATQFPWRTFWPLTLVGGACWALYSVAVGLMAGHWARQQPLLAALIGIVIAVVLGIVLDQVISAVHRRRAGRRGRAA